MTSDVDFEQFIKLLDGALASDDPTIRQALRKFLFVAAMVLGDDAEPGPFTKMMETMDDLQKRIHDLESKELQTTPTYDQWTWPPPGSPYWGGGSSGGFPNITYTNTGTSTGNAGSTSTTTNAVSTTTTGGSSTTSGQINITSNSSANGCYNTGNWNFPNATTQTITSTWIPPFPAETGTEIKTEIEEALDRLAKAS